MLEIQNLFKRFLQISIAGSAIWTIAFYLPQTEIADSESEAVDFPENVIAPKANKKIIKENVIERKTNNTSLKNVFVNESPPFVMPQAENYVESGENEIVASNMISQDDYEKYISSSFELYNGMDSVPLSPAKSSENSFRPSSVPFRSSLPQAENSNNEEKDLKDEKNDSAQVQGGSVQVSVESNRKSGAYHLPFFVDLIFKINGVIDLNGKIYYCLKSGGDCCLDYETTTLYLNPIAIGDDGNGEYCLSFYGESSFKVKTEVAKLKVSLDTNSLAEPEVATSTQYLQTTERYSYKFPMLSYSQNANGTILTIHSLEFDPGGTPDCRNIYETEPVLDLDDINGPDYVDYQKYLENFFDVFIFNKNYIENYYDYYFVSVLRKKYIDIDDISCSMTKITIEDFPVFNTQAIKQLSHSTTSLSLLGGFVPYGYFRTSLTATGTSGAGRFNELRSGFINTVY